ncbi:hypothetical protein TB2_029556 [Malus domestica]
MGFQRSKRRAQKSKKPIQKSKRRQLSQKLGLRTNHRFQISKSVSFLSLVSTRHTQTQLCENHEKFIEASISNSGDAPVSLSLVSTFVTCRESFTEITGSLSKRQFQPSVFLSLVSFEEITGNLSTISVEVENT